jgi:hypothetical protein
MAKKKTPAAAMPPIMGSILIISCVGVLPDLNLVLGLDGSELKNAKDRKLAIFI